MNIPRTVLQPRADTTPTADKSNIITIVTWATLVLAILGFLARQCVKFAMGRKAGIDDLFILAATVFAVGLSITILILASDGLGILGVLTLQRATAIMKEYYASNFLYVMTLGFAKLSLLSWFYTVYHQRGQRRVILTIGIFILVWTLASLVAVAFQCGLPRPWEILTLHCFNIGVFWIVYCIIDMTSDVAIIMLSVNLVAYLKVPLSRKIAVVACFAPRILVIGAALTRLIYLYPISPHNNPAFNLWIPLICTQVQACVSIVTACIPYVRPFFETTEASTRRLQTRSKHVRIDEESYGCCSAGYFRGPKKSQGHSADSTTFTNSAYGRMPEVSPRIPSPAPLSPLTPPRFNTPPDTSVNSSRRPRERGLRLHIPPQGSAIQNTPEFSSPQTASSHALSPACLSPRPLLASIPLSPMRPNAPLSPTAQMPLPGTAVTGSTAPSPSRPQPPRRFSLFPSQQPQYSPLPQQRARPPLSIPIPIPERPRSNTITPVPHMLTSQTPETRTPPPNAPLPKSSSPRITFAPRLSASLERVAYDDPLRTVPTAVTTSTAVQAPLPAALPAVHNAHTSIPSYYANTPPTAPNSTFSSAQSVPSYYTRTPPASQPPTFSHPNPYAYEVPPPPAMPTSPQRQRNNRILAPQNSSRRDQMSPTSAVSSPTRLTFWREESSSGSAATQKSPDGWEEAQLMPVVQDARSSPRIVVQRFS